MRTPLDLTGQTFDRWTILKRGRRPRGLRMQGTWWRCQCACGTVKTISLGSLRSGNSRSCGCLAIEAKRQRATKHGGCGTPEYKTWSHLLERCLNPSCRDYRFYGGRGIAVCARWRSDFSAFLADMGPRPTPKHSIERINHEGPYAPENCQWAMREQQAVNRRNTRVFTYSGHTGTLRQLAERAGLTYSAVQQRLATLHWTLEQALSTPPAGNHGSIPHPFTRTPPRSAR